MKKKIPLLISALLMLTFAISGCENIVLVPGRSSGASRSKSRLKSQSKSQAGGANGTSVRGRKTSSAGI